MEPSSSAWLIAARRKARSSSNSWVVGCWISLPLILRLDDSGWACRPAWGPRRRAPLRHLQRLQLHLDRRDLLPEPRVLDSAAGRPACFGGEIPCARHALLGVAEAGNAAHSLQSRNFAQSQPSVSSRQGFRPAPDIVEKHLVDLAAAIHGEDRPAEMPWVFMSMRMKEMPCCFSASGSVRTDENPVGILRQRGPGFLAVDDVVVALAHGLGLERGKVGAGAGLRKALAHQSSRARIAASSASSLLVPNA